VEEEKKRKRRKEERGKGRGWGRGEKEKKKYGGNVQVTASDIKSSPGELGRVEKLSPSYIVPRIFYFSRLKFRTRDSEILALRRRSALVIDEIYPELPRRLVARYAKVTFVPISRTRAGGTSHIFSPLIRNSFPSRFPEPRGIAETRDYVPCRCSQRRDFGRAS